MKIVNNTSSVIAQVRQKSNLFIRLALDDAHRNAYPVTPRKRGNLAKDVLKTVTSNGRGRIEWRKSYAGPQERGIVGRKQSPVRNYTTPGTGPHFAEDSIKKTIANSRTIASKAGLR